MAALEQETSPPNITQTDGKREIWKIRKNVVIISFAFFFNFLSFQGLSRLQSSLHKDAGIGVISAGVLYLVFTVTCLFIPNPLIAAIGYKWTIGSSLIFYILWMAANGYAVWGTMLTASALVGLTAGPLWTAMSAYLSLLAPKYASLTNTADETVITRFFGFFFFTFNLAEVFGSIISSTVLNRKPTNMSDPVVNYSLCGFNDCPYYNVTNTNLDKLPSHLVWTLVGVYIGVAFCGILLVVFFLDEIPKELKKLKSTSFKETCHLFLVTLKLFGQKEMVLLTPITAYITLQSIFYSAEFTKSFVSCTMGIWMIGYVSALFGILRTFTILSSSFLTKYTGRIPQMTTAALLDLASFLVMVFLHPTPDNAWIMLVLAAAYGFSGGIWRLHFSLYAIVFKSKPEAAFAARTTVSSIGSMLPFFYSYYICTSTKLFILIFLLITSYTAYLAFEILHKRSKR